MTSEHIPQFLLDTRQIPAGGLQSGSTAGQEACHARIMGEPRWKIVSLAEIADRDGNQRALAEAWRQFGTRCVEQISGPFAFVIHDTDQGLTLAATDRLGRQPVYYQELDGNLVIASDIRELPGASISEIGPQALYNYVYFHMVPAPGSIYRSIRKLRAGELLSWSRGSVQVSRYWQPNFGQPRNSPEKELSGRLKHTLREAVESSIGHGRTTGAFLSGGLDSSTVAGMLAESSGGQAKAFTIGFNADGYDEVPFARLTARHFGLELHEYYVTPDDIVDQLPKIAANFAEPFGNSSALPAYFCAKLAASQGIDHLLAGDGGDELFAGNERYARQLVLGHYKRIPGLLRRWLLEPIVRSLPSSLPLATKAQSYIAQANTPLPDRMQAYNFLERHLPEELFNDSFLSEVDTTQPIKLLRDTYLAPEQGSDLDRMLYLDWQYTLADNDLRKVSETCRYAGVQVSYPMLDDALLELSLLVPDDLKIKRGSLRHFYKQSLTGWLPAETINKSKRGFGLPFGLWMREHKALRELALDSLVALKHRNLLKPAFIDRTIEMHRVGHAAYYGELVWILVVLELWLKARE